MSMSEAVSSCLANYANFSGRARRSEFWYWGLATGLISMVLGLIFGSDSIISALFSLATLLPGLAVCWRRMHDIGKCGAWYFIILVPIVGIILWVVWACRDSDPGTNQYGSCPK